MQPPKVIVLDHGDKEKCKRCMASVRLSVGTEAQVLVVPPDNLIQEIGKADMRQPLHIMGANNIVLPSFYPAMLTSLESTDRDYAICRVMDWNGKAFVDSDKPSLVQVIFMRWIFKELGTSDIGVFVSKLVAEYRGISVPHVLCVRG